VILTTRPKSYGFRPGRGCHDAIEAIFQVGKGGRGADPRRRWVLDADLAAASTGSITVSPWPTRHLPGQGSHCRLAEGGSDRRGRFAPTEEGTPQGGVVSPLLLNITLHGMERAAGVRYHRVGADGAVVAADSPALVRYVDDLVAVCRSRNEAEWVKAKLANWLAVRGLAFNEDKTHVVTFDEGFDFLGFTVRRYHGKLLIRPSNAAIRRIRERLRTEVRSPRGRGLLH
jgi:RNA-directed DNA polymerase